MSMPASTSFKTNEQSEAALQEFACDVRAGLSKPQKELHSKYLYDELGSALFEAITLLPEYGLTRADERLLSTYADEIAAAMPKPLMVLELGSGSGRKTRHVLAAIRALQDELTYFPIDVSGEVLARCINDLSDLATVRPLQDTYLEGVTKALAQRRAGEKALVLFLGSTIGNFERSCADAFLKDLRSHLNAGDALLMGADLAKQRSAMLLAYDDPTGVTAAFNLNLLGRVNRELDADFDLRQFQHEVRYNEREQRIEMHLRSQCEQQVTIAALDHTFAFRHGETIWTESSHKYQRADLHALADSTGWAPALEWLDTEWPFAEVLWIAR